MKARNRVAVSALRSALVAIENGEAVEVTTPRQVAGNEYIAGATSGRAAEVDRRDRRRCAGLVQSQVDQRSMAVREYEELGRQDVADRLRAEADVMRGYLPSSR